MTYRWIVRLASLFLRVIDVRITVRGVEQVPERGPAVLAISHFSYLDFMICEWAIWRSSRRLTRFLAIQAAFSHWLSGPAMRAMGHIPVGRGPSAYRSARTALRHGELVGVFPETRVSRCFTLLAFKDGAAKLAMETGAPLVPCVVWGSHRIMTRTHPRALLKTRHTPVLIAFGPPLEVQPGESIAGVTARLRATMQDMLTQLQDSYAVEEPGAWWVPAHRGGCAPTPSQALLLDGRQ